MNIKELSRELEVSEQALRSWCKRNGVRKESESESKGKKAGYFLTESDVESIKMYYSAKGKREKEAEKGNESKTLDILAEQLAEKDKQIASLLEQLKAKAAQLLQLNDTLTAAQALHAGTIQALQDKQESQAQYATAMAAEQSTAAQDQIKELSEQLQELKAENQKKEQAQEKLTARITELETAAATSATKSTIWSRLFRRSKK